VEGRVVEIPIRVDERAAITGGCGTVFEPVASVFGTTIHAR
jgi:hypothetical protein